MATYLLSYHIHCILTQHCRVCRILGCPYKHCIGFPFKLHRFDRGSMFSYVSVPDSVALFPDSVTRRQLVDVKQNFCLTLNNYYEDDIVYIEVRFLNMIPILILTPKKNTYDYNTKLNMDAA